MTWKYFKLVFGILSLVPFIAMMCYCSWRGTPMALQAIKDIYISPGTRIILGIFCVSCIVSWLFFIGIQLIEDFKSDQAIDEQLKANMSPEAYKAYAKYVNPINKFKRWLRGTQ